VTPLKVAIVGPGKIAQIHAEALGGLSSMGRLVAVLGRAGPRLAGFSRRNRVDAYETVSDLVRKANPQVAIVCTPHPTHASVSVDLLSRSVSVLVEKPMALSAKDCDVMIDAARESGATLGVVSQRRFYEPVRRVKAAIATGRIGQPVLATVELLGWRGKDYYAMDGWRGTRTGEGGGVLVNQAVHHLDLLQWFMGPAESLFGYCRNFNHPFIEVEDTAVAVVNFRNGAIGAVIASNSQNPGLFGRIHIYGDSGAAVGVQTESGSAFVAGVTSAIEPAFNDLWTVPGDDHLLGVWQEGDRRRAESVNSVTYYHREQLADFLEAVQLRAAPQVTGEDGRRSVALFEAIYNASASNRIAPVS
jgi:UDP-N-acetyl-2-amino-2-deoxyglucuronate dehydrogenase